MLLTTEQLAAGLATLVNHKLTKAMVDDLVAIFRGFLGDLEANYPISATLTAEDDNDGLGARRCEKLAACLLLFQENQFTPESGFAPTAANRTGFNYSLDGEVFQTFLYCFGLFWPVPRQLADNKSTRRGSAQGRFVTTLT